jgi:hypothetical protein
MNYIQVISDFFSTGSLPQGVAIESSMMQQLENDRKNLDAEGLILFIEPQDNVKETVREVEDGSRVVKYNGSFIQAYKKDGLLQPTPSGPPFENQNGAMEYGEMSFMIDQTGAVVSWYNSLDGNTVGKENVTAVERKKNKQLLYIIGAIMVLFILWKLFGGLLF